MLELRPLLVITGNIRIEGGEEVKSQQTEPDVGRDKEHFSVVRDTTITKPRRKANVIVTDFWRRFRAIRLLHCPFGNLVSDEKRKDLDEILTYVDGRIAKFNREEPNTCRIFNCIIVERLKGVRQAKTAGWVATHTKHQDVKAVLSLLSVDV